MKNAAKELCGFKNDRKYILSNVWKDTFFNMKSVIYTKKQYFVHWFHMNKMCDSFFASLFTYFRHKRVDVIFFIHVEMMSSYF